MKILLINPNINQEIIYGQIKEVGNIQQPLGLAYLAAVLEEEGHKIQIIDALIKNYDHNKTMLEAKKFEPDLIGLTSTTAGINTTIALAKILKENVNCPIILGGAHITAIPKETMQNDCFDLGVIGEGEYTILEIVSALEKKQDIKKESIKGVTYKKNNQIIITPKRDYIKDLDSLPLPARHLLPNLSEYKPTPASCKNTPLGSMITSRGCVYRCIYCDRAIFGQKFRARSVNNVLEEIEYLIKDYKIKEIKFWDDTFSLDKQRVIGICKEMIKRKMKLSWTCIARVNNMDPEILKWMKDAGCWQIAYGIESGDNHILELAKKDVTTEFIRKIVNLTKKSGIEVRGFFMLGLPGETKETMQKTIDFAKSLPLNDASFYITTIYPNTELWGLAIKSGEARIGSWDTFSPVNPDKVTYIPKGLSEEVIKEYHKKAYRSFYFRPSYLIKRVFKLRNVKQLIWDFKGFLTLIKLKVRS